MKPLPSFIIYLFLSDSDDNEDIKVHRKPRRNAIKDSDTEEDEEAAKTSVNTAEAMVSSDSSEELETPENMGRAAQKSKRISRARSVREESESEQVNGDAEDGQEEARKGVSPVGKEKKREKSRRHREKKEKQSRAVEKLKKKEQFSVSELHFPHFLLLSLYKAMQSICHVV